MIFIGEVTEWPNVLDSKSSELLRVPRVQIPPSPPDVNIKDQAI